MVHTQAGELYATEDGDGLQQLCSMPCRDICVAEGCREIVLLNAMQRDSAAEGWEKNSLNKQGRAGRETAKYQGCVALMLVSIN